MRMLLGIVGLCLIGFAVGTYFANLLTGICVFVALFGMGLTVDALRK